MEFLRTVCELLRSRRPNGRLKVRECRKFLNRLDAERAPALPDTRQRRADGGEVGGQLLDVGQRTLALGDALDDGEEGVGHLPHSASSPAATTARTRCSSATVPSITRPRHGNRTRLPTGLAAPGKSAVMAPAGRGRRAMGGRRGDWKR